MAVDVKTPKGYRKAWNGTPLNLPPVQHGVDCRKVEHTRDGMLHAADDDTPYDVDGILYCGRCHTALDVTPPSFRELE